MKRIQARLWDAQRFALLPPGLLQRLRKTGQPRTLVVSLPKAGTHLLERALLLHTPLYRKLVPTITEENLGRFGGLPGLIAATRAGQVLVSHLPFKQEWLEVLRSASVKTILMKRDPRDIVVSNMFYIKKRTDHRINPVLENQTSDRERLRVLIEGDPNHGVRGINQVLDRFAGWLESADFVASYEQLIGPKGGGSRHLQTSLISDMFSTIGLNLPDSAAPRTADELFSSASPTYRKGVVGQWREYLDEELLALYNLTAGELASAYGYEPLE